MPRCRIGRGHGPYHFASGGWKNKEALGGGPVDRPEWTHPEVGRAEEHGWRHQRMDWYYIGGRGDQFNRASRTNCKPASQPETSRMPGKGANPQEKILCPKCRSRGAAKKPAEARPEHASGGTQTEGDEPGSFTRMRSKDSDSGSDNTTTGLDSWRSARGKETVLLTTPRPRGRVGGVQVRWHPG